MSKNVKDVFEGTNKQVVDVNFTMRRTSRQPLEDNQLMVSYAALVKEMVDPNSSIYKGQIVVTQGPEDQNPINFTPYLIKNDEATNTSYYADRIATSSYIQHYLDGYYVKKVQLGTTYTGVGQWEDVKGTDGSIPTTSYSEIFNDYKTNSVGIKSGYTRDAKFAHVEGSNNTTNGDTSHVEGDNNTNSGTSSHVEGSNNSIDTDGNYSHAEGYGNRIQENVEYSHVEGKSNIVNASGAHAQGIETTANGVGSFSGGYQTNSNGTYSTALGIGNTSEGSGSVALGQKTSANGVAALTAGQNTIANGDFSTAFGNSTQSKGESSLTAGNSTMAEGNYSVAFGDSTTANGISSLTEGYKTIAKGTYSHAEGQETTAMGQSSHAEGYNTYANGNYSHVEGSENTAGGSYSHAEGYNTYANGEASHAEGYGNKINTSANYSHTEGSDNTIDSTYTHVEGANNTSNNGANFSHIEGQNNTSNGKYSHIEGYNNTSETSSTYTHIEGTGNSGLSEYGHIEGEGNTIETTGTSSHAEGHKVIISGKYAHAEGDANRADGESSHVEGGYNETSNLYAHAEGTYTRATGMGSHAEGGTSMDLGQKGTYTQASGDYSHAEGFATLAQGDGSHSEGYYTVSGTFDTGGNVTNYGHAEGGYSYAAGSYSHAEGWTTRSYGIGAHAQGIGTIATGDYSSTNGSYTQALNRAEVSFGSYNRSYLGLSDGSSNQPITSFKNEFARLGGKYIAGRYPAYTPAADGTYYYDTSYETLFTIGDGQSDGLVDLSKDDLLKYDEANRDAGQQVRDGRHNIMDIRKNGQMYYSGGIIAGGEIVAPMSYSYVASLGPTAYFTTIMAALLTQPEYYKPSLHYKINQSGEYDFNRGSWSIGTVEVGSTVTRSIQFCGHRIAHDVDSHLDPLYGINLGNMLGYSVGVTEIIYKHTKNDGRSASTMNGDLETKTISFTSNPPASYLAGTCSTMGMTDSAGNYDAFRYDPKLANATTQAYSNIVNLTVGTETTYNLYQVVSYTFAPPTSMVFQQLANKGTYIVAAGEDPHQRWAQNIKYSSNNHLVTVYSRYKYYYGYGTVSGSAESIDFESMINKGTGIVADWVPNSVTTISKTQVMSTCNYVWFAIPANLGYITRYNNSNVTKGLNIYYKNSMNAESPLDSGWTTDTAPGGSPIYTRLTTKNIGNAQLLYRIYCCKKDKGTFTPGTWGFAWKRTVGAGNDSVIANTPLDTIKDPENKK